VKELVERQLVPKCNKIASRPAGRETFDIF
jgi:hypothetical protein